MDNAELITLLRERGYEVKSASSTIDNISAASLREEYGTVEADNISSEDAAEEPAGSGTDAHIAEPEVQAAAKILTKDEVERMQQPDAAPSPPPPLPSNKPAPLAPPGKAAPALPRPPGVNVTRQVSPPPVTIQPPRPQLPVPASTASAPVPVTPPVAPISAAPKAPAVSGPPPMQPPRMPAPPVVAAPKVAPPPVTPPRVSPPPVVAPPGGHSGPKAPPVPGPVAPPALGRPPVARPTMPTVKTPPAVPISRPGVVTPPSSVQSSGAEAADTGTGATGAATPTAPGLRKLQVKPPIVVRDFAVQMGKKPFQLISDLMEMSIFASMNYVIDEQLAIRLARNNGFELDIKHRGEGQVQQPVKEKVKVDESQLLEPRPPVVCILGHVDHGKTTLLDAIRHTNVVAGEAGGITQHIGAYQVEHSGRKITFIDTPGHAAFSNMRARGANVTDIAILVVAADDGFMPQTDEALSHAQTAGVPIVVAVNKMDSRGANLDRVKRQLQERNLTPEDWGGETLVTPVSALKGTNIDGLLESILLQAELIETLKANPKGKVEGVIMEAQKELGRGSTASVIVRNGTLKPGDALVSGVNYCRVRMLIDDKGQQIKSAPPATPVKVVGWSGPPDAGDTFYAVKNEREAKSIAEDNERERRSLVAAERQDAGASSVEDLFAAIAKTRKLTFRAVVKADVFGTAEALAIALENIKSDKIELSVVDTGVGDVTKNDVVMASASGASIIAFNVGMENGVSSYAKHQAITIIQHKIIYEIINQVKDAMTDLLEPELRENKIGAAEVRAVFPLAKGFVAGCMVTEGRIQRDAIARLFRKGQVVYESKIGTLKRFKDDASEVRAGFECGIQLDGYNGYQQGDVIECCEILKIKPPL